MSISGISSAGSIYQQGSQAAATGLGGYLQQLAAALQSGNLSSAQQALGQAQSSVQGIQAIGGASGSSAASTSQGGSLGSLLQQGLSKIGSDLQSGNLSAATTDLTALQQTMRSATAGAGQQAGMVEHHHHHHGGIGQPTAASTTAGSTASAASNAASTSSGFSIDITV